MKKILYNLKLSALAILILTLAFPAMTVEAKTGYHTETHNPGCQSSTVGSSETHNIVSSTREFWGTCRACGQTVRITHTDWYYTCGGTNHITGGVENIIAGTYNKGLHCSGTNYAPSGQTSGSITCNNHTRTVYSCPGHEVANSYRIVFNGNGNTGGNMSNLNMKYDRAKNLTANAFTKTGYTFAGWATSSTGGIVYSDGQSVSNLTATNNGTVNLYAKWTANNYIISYAKGESNTTASVPANTSCTYDSNVTLSGFGNLKGRSYTLSFNLNKGSSSQTPTNISNITGTLTGNQWKIGSTNYTAGSTLTKPNFTATNGGSVTATAQWNNKTLNNFSSPSMTGYIFAGWYDAATNGTKITSVTVEPGTTAFNKTLYAHWTANSYSITYDLNKGSSSKTPSLGTNAPTSASFDTEVLISNPTMEGYTFTGWTITGMDNVVTHYYRENRSNNYSSTTATSLSSTKAISYKNLRSSSGTVKFKANWKANTYYVDYDKGLTNNTGTTPKTTHTYDQDVTLASNKFTGRTYNLYFNANKPKNGFGQTTSSVLSNLPSTQSGNLTFNKWSISATYNSGNYAANTNLGKKNFESKAGATAHATALWNNKTLSWGNPSLAGYTFTGWYYSNNTKVSTNGSNNQIVVTPDNSVYSNTVYAHWSPNNNTKYTVNHWVQKVNATSTEHNSTQYELVNTETFTGTTDTLVTPDTKPPYDWCIAPAKQTVNINGDGSTVVNYYYDRAKVTLDVNGQEVAKQILGNTKGLCTFDMYVNGVKVANDVTDYYSTTILYGSTWEVKDIKPINNKNYKGADIN